jgi:hypothetical protein
MNDNDTYILYYIKLMVMVHGAHLPHTSHQHQSIEEKGRRTKLTVSTTANQKYDTLECNDLCNLHLNLQLHVIYTHDYIHM